MSTQRATTAQIILTSSNLHPHLYPDIALIWRTSGWNVWCSTQSSVLSDIGEQQPEQYMHIVWVLKGEINTFFKFYFTVNPRPNFVPPLISEHDTLRSPSKKVICFTVSFRRRRRFVRNVFQFHFSNMNMESIGSYESSAHVGIYRSNLRHITGVHILFKMSKQI